MYRPQLCCDSAVPRCGPQIASAPGLSDRYDSGELAGTNRVIDWIGARGSLESMDDPDSPATPRNASSFIASSLHGAGDCSEFDLLQTIRRLEKEKEEALAEIGAYRRLSSTTQGSSIG
jgi:hypothetical protein